MRYSTSSATRLLDRLLGRFEGVACSGAGGILVIWLLVAVELNGHCWMVTSDGDLMVGLTIELMGNSRFNDFDITLLPWQSIMSK
ncbi:hypothetical protein BYT27DRAFT_7184341 [Phlegmacium glaucopus]|nr:hypothetical protein BYT27DRAFT_7184341 [Phlegmacium glaucopus]